MPLNLNRLRVLYLVAREGSLRQAGELLRVTPPAVTHAIRDLETYYGVRLFEKVGRGVRLSQEGQILYEYVVPVFEAADRFEGAIKELGGRGIGELRVGTSRMFAPFLMSTITAFEEKYPLVKVRLRDSTSEDALRGVETLINDVALVSRQLYSPRVSAVHFKELQLTLVAGLTNELVGKSEVSWRDLEGQPLVGPEPGSGRARAIKQGLAEYGVTPTVVLETGSVEFMKEYAAQRGALAFVFEPLVRAELAAGRLIEIRLRETPPIIEIDVIFLPESQGSPAVRAFCQTLDESASMDWNVLSAVADRRLPGDQRRPR